MEKYFIRKYKFQGMYSDWKEISKKVAEKKRRFPYMTERVVYIAFLMK